MSGMSRSSSWLSKSSAETAGGVLLSGAVRVRTWRGADAAVYACLLLDGVQI